MGVPIEKTKTKKTITTMFPYTALEYLNACCHYCMTVVEILKNYFYHLGDVCCHFSRGLPASVCAELDVL